MSGASLIHDAGFLDCADIGSLEYLVMVDEIISMVKRMMRGIEVNPDTIMLDLIEKVGPGGHFLEEPITAALCRREIWIPRLLDRNAYAIWAQKGSQSMETRVREQVKTILTNHAPPPVSSEKRQKINSIIQAAEERYRS